MKVGAHVSIAGGLNNAITNAQNIGAGCIQIFSSAPQMWARKKYTDEELLEFKQLVNENNLNPVFVHAPYLPNICTDKPENLEKSIIALSSELQFVHAIGAEGLIVHLGSHLGQGFKNVKDQIIDSIAEIYKKAGFETKFLLENSSGKSNVVGAKFTEIGEIITELRSKYNYNVGICLDTAHMFASGYDIKTKNGVEETLKELRDTGVLEKTVCLHINDSKVELGNGNDRHENIGEGFIGKDGFTHFFKHNEFKTLPLILEVPGFTKNGPDKENIKILTDLVNFLDSETSSE